MMMMMAQKPPIRVGRPRRIIYDFREDAFEEANMLMEDADGIAIFQIEIIESRDHCFHILYNTHKRSGEGLFLLIRHAGSLYPEDMFFEAEEKLEGISGVVRLKIGENELEIGGKGSRGKAGRGLGRKEKDRAKIKRTSCWSNPKHAECGTETVYIPNPPVDCFYHPPVQLPPIVVPMVLLPFHSVLEMHIPHTSSQDKSLARKDCIESHKTH